MLVFSVLEQMGKKLWSCWVIYVVDNGGGVGVLLVGKSEETVTGMEEHSMPDQKCVLLSYGVGKKAGSWSNSTYKVRGTAQIFFFPNTMVLDGRDC